VSGELTALHGSFLEIEQADVSHMHVGWARVFDPQPLVPLERYRFARSRVSVS
jgi:hypothetical protein